jgi:hypothetical protein
MNRIAGIAILVLVSGLTACGGGGGTSSPTPVATPPVKADVVFNVDPNPTFAESQGNGWWKFKVNLELYTKNEVGFTINTVRYTVTSALTGGVLLDNTEIVGTKVASRTVLQYTSPTYHMELGTRSAQVKFLASLTDDRGNALTLSNTVNVTNEGAGVEPPQ